VSLEAPSPILNYPSDIRLHGLRQTTNKAGNSTKLQ